LDTSFESKILFLLSQRRAVQGSADVVTCEEAEKGTLEDAKFNQEQDQRAFSKSSDLKLEGTPDTGRTRERCRQAAWRLAAKGEILITQDGKVVDPSFAKGTMELKLP